MVAFRRLVADAARLPCDPLQPPQLVPELFQVTNSAEPERSRPRHLDRWRCNEPSARPWLRAISNSVAPPSSALLMTLMLVFEQIWQRRPTRVLALPLPLSIFP